MSELESPNILNYTVGKGIVEVKVTGEEWRRLGNCPEFEFTPEVEKLEHFSSMEGVRSKDRTIIIEKKGTLRIVMEEITMKNLQLALLGGTIGDDSGGDLTMEIFDVASINAQVRFIGTNEVGPKYTWHFLSVDFIPSGAVNPISDEWMQLEISGDVATSGGSFGTIQKTADGV